MGTMSGSGSKSDTVQASNNNADAGGGLYFNITNSRLGNLGGATGGKGGDGAGGAGVSGSMFDVQMVDHGSVDRAFGLAELAMIETMGIAKSMRTSEDMAMKTMESQVQQAKQSDGGEGERMYKIGALLVGVIVVVSVVFGGKKRGNV